MQSFGKFIPYTPDTTNRPKVIDGQNVLFLQDDKGNDWYDVIELFDESKTLKIGYDDDGRVRTFTTNIHAFFPVNMSVANAEAERNSRMADVTTRIDWLEDAQKDGDISADEEKELATLRAYRTELRRLDLAGAPDIDWPEVPGDVA